MVNKDIDKTRETKYVFVVGLSRSGTSLMRQVLNRHSQMAICSETHYLGHLIPSEGMRYRFRKFGDLSNDDNVRRLVDYMYSNEFENYSKYRWLGWQWRWTVEKVPKEDFLQRILNSDRNERALFTITMQVFANYRNASIIGEKTPVHLRYVSTLMKWYPNAKIIHMLRDPRGIFVSELRRRSVTHVTPPFKQLKRFGFLFKLYIVLQTTIIWFESMLRYARYKKLYPDNYHLLKFENLVSDSERQIRQLCNFLGVEFQDRMLEQTVISQGFKAGQIGFDKKAAERWKEHIDPWINSWFLFWFGTYLKDFGYIVQSSDLVKETGNGKAS